MVAAMSRRKRQGPPWWSRPWAALSLFILSAALVAYPLAWSFLAAALAWTGCDGECGPPDKTLGVALFALVAALLALPFGVLVSAWRRWLGWLVIFLTLCVAALLGYWVWSGVL